jgi:hypothetical protein
MTSTASARTRGFDEFMLDIVATVGVLGADTAGEAAASACVDRGVE